MKTHLFAFITTLFLSNISLSSNDYYISNIYGLTFGEAIPSNSKIKINMLESDPSIGVTIWDWRPREDTPFSKNQIMTYEDKVIAVLSSIELDYFDKEKFEEVRFSGINALLNIFEKHPKFKNTTKRCITGYTTITLDNSPIGCQLDFMPTFYSLHGPIMNQIVMFKISAFRSKDNGSIKGTLMISDWVILNYLNPKNKYNK